MLLVNHQMSFIVTQENKLGFKVLGPSFGCAFIIQIIWKATGKNCQDDDAMTGVVCCCVRLVFYVIYTNKTMKKLFVAVTSGLGKSSKDLSHFLYHGFMIFE